MRSTTSPQRSHSITARLPAILRPINGGGIYSDGYDYGSAALTLNDCTVTGNTALSTYGYGSGGGIDNYGYYNGSATLVLTGSTITGNTGTNAGGIYNDYGTITGTLTSANVHGNTATSTSLGTDGADFYDSNGTATFVIGPDVAGGHVATLAGSLYSSGAGGAITIDPAVTTLDLSAPVTITNGSTVTTAVATVNVAAGTGTNDQYVVNSGMILVGSGGTVNLASGSSYGLGSDVLVGQSLTLNGNGAILDGSNGAGAGTSVTRPLEIDGSTAGVTVTVNNLTLKNGNGAGSGAHDTNDGGGLLVYAENGTHAMVTLNSCTITGNTAAYNGGGIYNDGYYNGDANLTLVDSTVTGNMALPTYGYGYGGGIANYGYYNGDATLTLTNSTVTGNTGQQLRRHL